MSAKMTAQTLIDTYSNNFGTMTRNQLSVLKGNITWLTKRTTDVSEMAKLQYLANELGMKLPINQEEPSSNRVYLPAIYKVQLVRDPNSKSESRPSVRSAADVNQVIMEFIGCEDREHLVVIMLDTRNRVIGINEVSIGTLNSALATPREVFKPAILSNAASIILAHNHPSGDPTPSPEDVRVTRTMVDAGKLLDIEVLDHIVVGDGRFVSLKERGLGF